jgi:hypothetical protein
MFDQVEVLLEDADVCLAGLDRIHTVNDLEGIVNSANRLIANAKLMGINRKDGQQLADWGMVEQRYVDSLTDIRDLVKGESVGFESDSGNMVGNLIAAAVIALGLLLAYIVGKLVGILIAVFSAKPDAGAGGALIAASKDLPGGDKDKLSLYMKTAVEANDLVDALTPSEIFGGPKEAISKYRYLGYSEKFADDFKWVTDLLDEISSVTKELTANLPEKSLTITQAQVMLGDVVNKPRQALVKLLELVMEYTNEMYEGIETYDNTSKLNHQLVSIKEYKNGSNWKFRETGDMATLNLSKVVVINEGYIKSLTSRAESSEKATEKLGKVLKTLKVDDRKANVLAARYMNLAVNDVIGLMLTVLRKVIITALLDKAKWHDRSDKLTRHLGSKLLLVTAAGATSDKNVTASDFMECVNNVNAGGELPESLKSIETALRPAPKDLRGFTTRVLEMHLK